MLHCDIHLRSASFDDVQRVARCRIAARGNTHQVDNDDEVSRFRQVPLEAIAGDGTVVKCLVLAGLTDVEVGIGVRGLAFDGLLARRVRAQPVRRGLLTH